MPDPGSIRWKWGPQKTVTLSNEIPSTGTGESPNPYRQEPATTPGRLGENTTPVTRLGGAAQYEQEAHREITPTGPSAATIEERNAQGQTQGEERDADQANETRADLYAKWQALYDRMTPAEQAREVRRQDALAARQQYMDDYLREHPGFRIDEHGEIWGDDVTREEDQELHRKMAQRDRAQRQIDRGHRPYTRETINRPWPTRERGR